MRHQAAYYCACVAPLRQMVSAARDQWLIKCEGNNLSCLLKQQCPYLDRLSLKIARLSTALIVSA